MNAGANVILALLSALGGALAAEHDADGFVLADTNGVRWTITRYELPELVEGADAGFAPGQTCALRVRAREAGVTPQTLDCEAALAALLGESVLNWSGHVEAAPGHVGLFDLRFELVAAPSGGLATRLTVDNHQSSALRGASLPGVSRRSEPELTRMKPIRLPEGLPPGRCAFTVFVDDRGRVARLDFDDCDESARDAVSRSLRRWRFSPLVVDDVPLPSELPMSIATGPRP